MNETRGLANALAIVIDDTESGLKSTVIAKKVGYPRSTVWRWQQDVLSNRLSMASHNGKQAVMHRGRLLPLEGAVAASPEVSEVQVGRTVPRIETSPQELWATCEKANSAVCDNITTEGRFFAKFGNEPIGISFISDQHIAAREATDLKQMREDAEIIADTKGMYAIFGGDSVNNHIKHRSAIISAKTNPTEQFELFEHYLSMFGDKLLVLITGNHDHWTKQISGIDMINRIGKQNKICYSPHHAYIDTQVGEVNYRIAVRHQYRFGSQFNLCHTVKRWWEMGEYDFDVGCIGHHHEPSIETFTKHGLQRWACRPGSYQLTTDFSSQMGFNIVKPTCPTFILYPDERRIVGFDCLRNAADFLEVARS